MPTQILHFTIGPVQGFIAEARRTRDLWAGSFLLSWLTGQAMVAIVGKNGSAVRGKIDFPQVLAGFGVDDDPLLSALRNGVKNGDEGPFIGSIPNRFKATVDAGFDPSACADAVRAAWRQLAEAVWTEFVQTLNNKREKVDADYTRKIWDRQIENFWEINWVLGPEAPNAAGQSTDGAWLDRRKNWRSHYPSEPEGGDHCQIMGHYQEISGFVRGQSTTERERQDKFWNTLRRRVGPYNLRRNERLCAIALVKRFFPLLKPETMRKVIGWWPGPPPDSNNRSPIRNWPSVSFIAAVPWLTAATQLAGTECEAFSKLVYQNTENWRDIGGMTDGVYGETCTTIKGLDKGDFAKLDGQFFFEDAIRSMDVDVFERNTGPDDKEDERRAATLKALGTLVTALDKKRPTITHDGKPVRVPSPRASEFYAVLLVDGDEIGKKLREDPENARRGLARFTVGAKSDGSGSKLDSVPEIIAKHQGVTIYAGGDDVLAILPLDTAINAACALNKAYGKAFDLSDWTMSAAIVFAQYRVPLRAVLEKAHDQLDRVAKDRNGRDSLAVAVFKPGGLTFEWVSTWQLANGVEPPLELNQLALDLQLKQDYSTGFFYNVRERYAPLFIDGHDVVAGGSISELMDSILIAEFQKGGGKGDAKKQVERLLKVALPGRRFNCKLEPAKDFSFDAALIARFLAEEGRWFMGKTKPGGSL